MFETIFGFSLLTLVIAGVLLVFRIIAEEVRFGTAVRAVRKAYIGVLKGGDPAPLDSALKSLERENLQGVGVCVPFTSKEVVDLRTRIQQGVYPLLNAQEVSLHLDLLRFWESRYGR